MNLTRRYILTATVVSLMGAALLGGCGNPTGYSEEAPPAGGPQQNSHVPPGERANTASSSKPAAQSH